MPPQRTVHNHMVGIIPSYSNWAQGALGGIVVYCYTPVGQEQAEGVSTAQTIAERFSQITLARNAQELLF